VGPSFSGACSVAQTGTSKSAAAAPSRATLATISLPPLASAGTSRSWMSMSSTAAPSAEISMAASVGDGVHDSGLASGQ